LCTRETAWLRKRDKRGRIQFTDITAEDFDASQLGVSREVLMTKIHGRLPDGRVVTGVEVFRQLYTAVGFGRLVWLSRLPLVAPLLDLGYRWFAKNRMRLTGRCDAKSCVLPVKTTKA
jgi:predicted DCC family thiol-disulfide oxidoreductase YuxK